MRGISGGDNADLLLNFRSDDSGTCFSILLIKLLYPYMQYILNLGINIQKILVYVLEGYTRYVIEEMKKYTLISFSALFDYSTHLHNDGDMI